MQAKAHMNLTHTRLRKILLQLARQRLFLEQRFGIVVAPQELIPENFVSVDAIGAYLRARQQVEGVQV